MALAENTPQKTPHPARVLVVEDEREVAELLAFNLERRGHRVARAHDAMTACRLIAEEPPDVILLDLLLPDLDGREVAELLREHDDPDIASIPILMVTALGAAADRENGFLAGADDYIAKPFSVREVCFRVERWAKARRERLAAKKSAMEAWRVESARREREGTLLHEVKNKLYVMRGFSRRLDDPGEEFTPSHVKECARHIEAASAYLSELVDHLEQLRRFEGLKKPALVPVNPSAVAAGVVALHKRSAEAKGQRIEFDSPPEETALIADETGLTVALSCLVENAVRHCPIMTTVTVAVHPGEKECTLVVADDGPGLPEATAHYLLEALKGGSVGAGAGMGLSIVRRMVAAMEGRIILETSPSQGTRFTLAFPNARPEEDD